VPRISPRRSGEVDAGVVGYAQPLVVPQLLHL
jgi:hypothetical protein